MFKGSKTLFLIAISHQTLQNQVDSNKIPFTLIIAFVSCKKNMSNAYMYNHNKGIIHSYVEFASKDFARRYKHMYIGTIQILHFSH